MLIFDGFALYYQAGLTGEDMNRVYNRHAWALTAPQKQAAYRAGQQDAAVFAARGRGGAGRTSTPLTVADRVRAALTGQRERATIGTAEAEDTVFSNEIDELQGRRWISYGDRQEFERDTGRITARRKASYNALKKAGFNLVDIYKTKVDISEYAYRMQRENNFEEVLAEVRTAQLLGGK